jgi:ABC-2 type transport system ATP-binding protein
MKRRLELVRGLLHRPEILFLDEPTLGLDPQTRRQIWSYLETLRRETGRHLVPDDALLGRSGAM